MDHEVWGPEKLNLMIQSNAATAGMNLKARLHFLGQQRVFESLFLPLHGSNPKPSFSFNTSFYCFFFQGSERQRLLYIERESYCAVEADLKRTWEHPESRHFGIPYWESHAFDPPRNGGVNEPREPFGVKALDIQSDKFQGRRHFPKKQGALQ